MQKRSVDYYDYSLLAIIILLTGFGLIMLYSTSAYTAELTYQDDMYFFKRQAVFSILAIGFAVAVSLIDYHKLWHIGGALTIASIVLMAMVMWSPLGMTVNGAKRWLDLGVISFQPSEVAKIAAIVYIPVWIVKMGRRYKGVKAILPPLGVAVALALPAYLWTDNLSTAIIIFLIAATIIFVAHPKTAGFIGAILVGLGLIFLAVRYIASQAGSGGSFRIMRILVWLNPEEYIEDGGYQVMQGLYAIGSGGFFGKGLGNSMQKLGTIPEAQNDMIFSIVCEELGIFGAAIVIMLFIYLLYRLFIIAQNAPDLYGALMVTGIFAHIATQVILNICVVLNLIPTTGITLPFFSYGGTSVMLMMMELSIALSVSRQIRVRQQERNVWGDFVHE